MKVSRNWLQRYFDTPLPSVEELADALTFHAFEIEETQDDMMDVKVLPNRGADCLSHRGIAKELAAILDLPLKHDSLREPAPVFPETDHLVVTADEKYVRRHTGALLRGVKIAPSPLWLSTALESVGQRSINNVVDILNFVMLDIGQPSGAFDLAKIRPEGGVYTIDIRRAKKGEKIKVLTGEEYTLTDQMFAFTDALEGTLLDIAGIKGGLTSGVSDATTDLFISVGNYDGTLIRRAAQSLKLFTDASSRYQNRPSPELTAYGMRDILALVIEIAGGEVDGVVDIYPTKSDAPSVSVSLSKINGVLGSRFSHGEVANVFERLDLPAKVDGDTFTITPPFERTDLVIPEDLVEEVGRLIGYDKIASVELPSLSLTPDQTRYRGIERMKDQLIEQGYTEVSTQSFATSGDAMLANPLDKTKPALRTSLEENLEEALAKAKRYAPLVLPPGEKPKFFEVGTVFPKEGEYLELRMTERVKEWGDAAGISDNLSIAKLEDYGKDYTPKQYALGAYKPFSVYPFVVRDIAMWTPEPITEGSSDTFDVLTAIVKNYAPAAEFFTPIFSFDYYKNPNTGRTSEAFKIVFQSIERTLTDEEINNIMTEVTTALTSKGYEVR